MYTHFHLIFQKLGTFYKINFGNRSRIYSVSGLYHFSSNVIKLESLTIISTYIHIVDIRITSL